MPKAVRLLCSFSGDWMGNHGDVVIRPSGEADAMIRGGLAEKPSKAAAEKAFASAAKLEKTEARRAEGKAEAEAEHTAAIAAEAAATAEAAADAAEEAQRVADAAKNATAAAAEPESDPEPDPKPGAESPPASEGEPGTAPATG